MICFLCMSNEWYFSIHHFMWIIIKIRSHWKQRFDVNAKKNLKQIYAKYGRLHIFINMKKKSSLFDVFITLIIHLSGSMVYRKNMSMCVHFLFWWNTTLWCMMKHETNLCNKGELAMVRVTSLYTMNLYKLTLNRNISIQSQTNDMP